MGSLAKQKYNGMIDDFTDDLSFQIPARFVDIDNVYFEQMVHKIYPAGIQLKYSFF